MKNKKIRLILAIAVFISLIVSSTYAYYAINASGSAHAGFTGNSPVNDLVSVTQQISDLHIHIKETDMSKNNMGDYYATYDNSLNYVKDLQSGTYNIVNISPSYVGPNTNQECSIDLKVKSTGSMKSVLHYGDMKLWIRIDGKENVLDLSRVRELDEVTYKLRFNLEGSAPKNIEMYLKLINRDYDQNYLSDSELNLDIETENLKCELVEEIQQLPEIIEPDVEWTVDDPVVDTRSKAYAKLSANFSTGINTGIYNKSGITKTTLDSVKFVDYIDSSITYENGAFKYDTERISVVYDLTDLDKSPNGTVIGWLQGNDLYIGTDNKRILTFDLSYAFNKLTINNLDFTNLSLDETTNMSNAFYNSHITKANYEVLNTDNITNMQYLFSGSSGGSLDLSTWNTKKVQDISGLFYNSTYTEVNLANWNLKGLTKDITSAFTNAKITTVSLSGWTLPKINMKEMFYNSKYIKNIDVSNMDASLVEDMSNMFNRVNLSTLNLTGLKTGKNITSFFSGMTLPTFTGIDKMDVSHTENFNHVFSTSNIINTDLNLSMWDMNNAKEMALMFSYSSFEYVNLSGWDLSNVQRFVIFDQVKFKTLDISNWILPEKASLTNFLSGESVLYVNMKNLDASKISDMSYMFQGCTQLQTVDMTAIKTNNITDMRYMFQNCSKLNRIIGIEDLDVSNVTNMDYMFKDCLELESLDLHNWNVSKVRRMASLFYGAKSLTKINVSGWSFGEEVYMSNMFDKCDSLEYVDLSTWENYSNIKDISSIFHNGMTADISAFDYEFIDKWAHVLFNYSNSPSTVYVKNNDIKNLIESEYPNITVIVR